MGKYNGTLQHCDLPLGTLMGQTAIKVGQQRILMDKSDIMVGWKGIVMEEGQTVMG